MEGSPEQVLLEPEALPAMSISSDDDTDSTEESDGEYNSEHDSDVDMRREDDVDKIYGVVVNGVVDMVTDGDDDLEEDEEEQDDEDEEEEDENKDDGKEPRTIIQGEIANSSADKVSTEVDDQPIVVAEQGQEMRKHAPRLQRPVPAPRPQTPEPLTRPWTPEAHPRSGLKFFGLVTPQKPCPAAPSCAMGRQLATLWMSMWISN